MADQTISTRALKRLAAEHGETRLLLFDAQERLSEAQQKITTLEADKKTLTTERDDLRATIARLMGGPAVGPDSAPVLTAKRQAERSGTVEAPAPPAVVTNGGSHA